MLKMSLTIGEYYEQVHLPSKDELINNFNLNHNMNITEVIMQLTLNFNCILSYVNAAPYRKHLTFKIVKL